MAVSIYTDLFFLSIVPIVLQFVAVGYLVGVRRWLGMKSTVLFLILNALMITYNFIVLFLIFASGQTEDVDEPIEAWGLFIAFGFPTGEAIVVLLIERMIASGYKGFSRS